MVMTDYIPDRGDIIWLTFNPQAGHEQAGRRPALVISPRLYNAKTSLILTCPITSQIKGYPFEVALPQGISIQGVILSDQIRSLDWRVRLATYIQTAPQETVEQVLERLQTLLGR
jgi:mRNA interferase MazF